MPNYICVSFNPIKQVYLNNLLLKKGDNVLVSTEYGKHFANVINVSDKFRDINQIGILQGSVEKVEEKEIILKNEQNQKEEKIAVKEIKKIVRENNITLSIVCAKYSIERDYLIIYFSSEKMVDFRELLKHLSKKFSCKIRLENVGDNRSAASIIGGLGICGESMCCSKKDVKYLEISKTQIKNQKLAPNPIYHLGGCSKLRCCLSFEDEVYQELKRDFPEKGTRVKFEKNIWYVVDYNLLKREVILEKNEQDGKSRITCSLKEITW